jgi:hypothetical protein
MFLDFARNERVEMTPSRFGVQRASRVRVPIAGLDTSAGFAIASSISLESIARLRRRAAERKGMTV